MCNDEMDIKERLRIANENVDSILHKVWEQARINTEEDKKKYLDKQDRKNK